jgi:hypothetical protein
MFIRYLAAGALINASLGMAAWGCEPAVGRMTSPVVFGINSSAARGLNVPALQP